MARSAVQYKMTNLAVHAIAESRVIDIRTRKPWRPRQTTDIAFLFELALTFAMMLLGAWLFLKMRG